MKIIGILLGLLICIPSYAEVNAAAPSSGTPSTCVTNCLQKVREFCQTHTDQCPHKGGAPSFCNNKCTKQGSSS